MYGKLLFESLKKMKDLANRTYGQKGTGGSKFVRRIAVLTLGAVAILAIVKLFFSAGSVISGQSVVLRDAPTGLKPVEADSDITPSDEGVTLTSQSAKLVAVGDVAASGTAKRTFGAGTYSLDIDTNLPDPKGNNYGVWLYDGAEVLLVDYLRGSGNSWGYELKDKDKYSGFDQIWITLEITKNDTKPEKHILEGSW